MNYNENTILKQLVFNSETTTTKSFLDSLNIKLTRDYSNFILQKPNLHNQFVYTDKFANDYLYQSSKMWCNSQRDYCPLVIALISVIILITIVLIIFLCIKNSFQCESLRRATQRLTNKFRFNTNTVVNQSCNQPRSNIETLAALRNPTVSRQSRSAFRNISNHFNSDRNVWFTSNKQTVTPPPPTYEESQNTIIRVKTSRNLHKLHSMPLSQSASINNAFSIETVNEEIPTALFPTYRCLALSTSPSTRATLQRLSNLSKQLLQENRFNEETTSALVRVGTLNINNDEIPPDYETVVKSTRNVNEAQISTTEILI